MLLGVPVWKTRRWSWGFSGFDAMLSNKWRVGGPIFLNPKGERWPILPCGHRGVYDEAGLAATRVVTIRKDGALAPNSRNALLKNQQDR